MSIQEEKSHKEDAWLTESRASRHISYRRELFDEFTPSSGGAVVLGNNGKCEVKGEGVIRIVKFVNGRWLESRMDGVTITRDDQVVETGAKQNNEIYRMLFRVIKPGEKREVNITPVNLKVRHERLGCVGARALCDMVRSGLVGKVKLINNREICV